MLEWDWDEPCKCYRAYDDFAIYVIFHNPESGYKIDYFPAPGPAIEWKNRITNLAEAKSLAEECVLHVKELRKQLNKMPDL